MMGGVERWRVQPIEHVAFSDTFPLLSPHYEVEDQVVLRRAGTNLETDGQ
jgi:hypothetical protein